MACRNYFSSQDVSCHVIQSELLKDCMVWTFSEIFLLLICQTPFLLSSLLSCFLSLFLAFFFFFKRKRNREKKGGWEDMNERLNLGVIFLLLHDVKHVWEMFSSSEVICPMQRMLEMKITSQIKIECVVFYLQTQRDIVTLIHRDRMY